MRRLSLVMALLVWSALTGCGEGDSSWPSGTAGGGKLPEQPHPDSRGFLTMRDGTDLRTIRVNGVNLSLTGGMGDTFSESERARYQRLKSSAESTSYPMQWAVVDLRTGGLIRTSGNAHLKFFGASTSKLLVAAALLDHRRGNISARELQLMADMLVVSSNEAWTALQRILGDGDDDTGRTRIHAFTQRMGYRETVGFQGWLGSLHGNELLPDEFAQFLVDIYENSFPGADTLWKVMFVSRTGEAKIRRYFPSNFPIGGKTGTYDGPNASPETVPFPQIRSRNHAVAVYVADRPYGIVTFSNLGDDEDLAVVGRGLADELGASGKDFEQ